LTRDISVLCQGLTLPSPRPLLVTDQYSLNKDDKYEQENSQETIFQFCHADNTVVSGGLRNI